MSLIEQYGTSDSGVGTGLWQTGAGNHSRGYLYQYHDHKCHFAFIHQFHFHHVKDIKLCFQSFMEIYLFISSTPRNSSNLPSLLPSIAIYQSREGSSKTGCMVLFTQECVAVACRVPTGHGIFGISWIFRKAMIIFGGEVMECWGCFVLTF